MAKASRRQRSKKTLKRKSVKKTKQKVKRGGKTSPKKPAALKKKAAARKKTPSRTKSSAKRPKRSVSKTPRKAARKKASQSGERSKAASSAEGFLGLRVQHVDFLTYKAEQVKKFYGETLGFPTDQRDTELNYLTVRTSDSSSLGFMPPHPQMAGEQPPPREPTLYFLVKDVDAIYAKLIAKGVAFMGPPQEMPWGDRVITTTDPEGRTVMIASRSKSS